MASYTGEHGKEFLHAQIKSLLRFYDPIVRDDVLGGFHNQLRDDGTYSGHIASLLVSLCIHAIHMFAPEQAQSTTHTRNMPSALRVTPSTTPWQVYSTASPHTRTFALTACRFSWNASWTVSTVVLPGC